MQFHETDSHIYGPEKEAAIKEEIKNSVPPALARKTKVEHCNTAIDDYLDALCSLPQLQKSNFKKLKVVFDSGHATTTLIMPKLLDRLGIEYKQLHGGLDSSYLDTLSANISEPGQASLPQLRDAVVNEKADAGFAFDCDADRFIVIDDKGHFVEADRTILLVADKTLAPGDVVSNVCTSLVTENILREKGFKIHHERWGQTFLSDSIRRNDACLGFEPDGHFIFPQLSLHADGIASAAFFSAALSSIEMPLSEYIRSLPSTFIEREKIDWSDDLSRYADAVARFMEKRFAGFRRLHERLFMAIADADGHAANGKKLVIRQSPFDSSLRISAEAPTKEEARQMIREAEELFR